MKHLSIVVKRKVLDRVYAIEQLGHQQALTPEGYLLCSDVPIARVGVQIYGPGETTVEVGKDGFARIRREEDEVFKAEAIASFEGKPVTNDHPPVDVSPENFKEYVVGIVQNVRRGEGINDDLLIADLLIHDKEAIEAVRDGKREVSCGYDAEYEQTEAGRGRQYNIMGNHVALVKNGRAGARCAIQDRRTEMKQSVKDFMLRAFKAKDAAEVEKLTKDFETAYGEGGSSENTHVHVHLNGEGKAEAKDDGEEMPDKKKKEGEEQKDEEGSKEDQIMALLQKICSHLEGSKDDTSEAEEEGMEGANDEEAEEKKDDKKENTKDTAARLEVLAPGTKLPVRDAKADAKKFADAIVDAKRKALQAASTGDHAAALKPLLTGVDVAKAAGATLDALFIGASEVVKAQNNAANTRGTVKTTDFGKTTAIEDINAKNRDFWSKQGVR